jgi:hypothetical protein
MKTRHLTIALLAILPIVAIVAKLNATNPDCNGKIPDAETDCLTGKQSCGDKYTTENDCLAGIGLSKIQSLVIGTHDDPGQEKCKTTLAVADSEQVVCADQYHCRWVAGASSGVVHNLDLIHCRPNDPVLDKDGKPCHTTSTVYISSSCNSVGCGG